MVIKMLGYLSIFCIFLILAAVILKMLYEDGRKYLLLFWDYRILIDTFYYVSVALFSLIFPGFMYDKMGEIGFFIFYYIGFFFTLMVFIHGLIEVLMCFFKKD